MENKIDFAKVLKSAISLPMVKINRAYFLEKELSKRFDENKVKYAIKYNPAQAGITVDEINDIADLCIKHESMKVSGLSFCAGIPGGLAMAGTIPADLTQYFGHILRILQKLAYLYGWDELISESNNLDTDTEMMLTLLIGVMFEVSEAASTITDISNMSTEQTYTHIVVKTIKKGTIYPVVRKSVEIIGKKMTKDIIAKGISKSVPIIGGVTSGSLTYLTYKPMANKLKNYLSTLNWADTNYYSISKNLEEKQVETLEEKNEASVVIKVKNTESIIIVDEDGDI